MTKNLSLDLAVCTYLHLSTVGKTFITGIARSYSTAYDSEHKIQNKLTPEEFAGMVRNLNDKL